jgi:tetratricopeptide (TPR) repeat protein
MQKGLLLILGLAVGSLVIGIYPTEFASAQRSTSTTYDDRDSEYRKKRKDRLLDLMKVGYYSVGRGSGFVTNAEREQALREMLAIRREFGDKRGEISDLIGIAETYAQRMRHREAIENLKIAIELARALGDVRIEYETLAALIEPIDILKGRTPISVYEYLIRRDSSFDWIEARFEYLDEKLIQLKLSGIAVPDRRYYTYTIQNIGDSYSSRKAYIKAIESYTKSIKRASDLLDREQVQYKNDVYETIAQLYLKTALLYKSMGNQSQADDALNNALDYYSRLGVDREYNNLSTAEFLTKGKIYTDDRLENLTVLAIAKNSEELIQRAIKARIAENHGYGGRIGDAYSVVANYKMAIQYYEQAIKRETESRLSRKQIDNRWRIEIYRKLARAYAGIGDVSTSLKYYLLAYESYLIVFEQTSQHVIANESRWREHREKLYRIIGRQPHTLSSSDSVGLLVEIGNLYKQIGEVDKAIAFYNKAQTILNNSPYADRKSRDLI